eukprot:TRINITY_DN100423_c0_g1_i1.p1 TRINITY_DN100423_c0_g1~~TRINITY_DN100423_c0_g1_i1.p1  ORF type:complete len:277 (+),score=40.60 TRINITY_DN100423_c0_g1_i1:97-927(+)
MLLTNASSVQTLHHLTRGWNRRHSSVGLRVLLAVVATLLAISSSLSAGMSSWLFTGVGRHVGKLAGNTRNVWQLGRSRHRFVSLAAAAEGYKGCTVAELKGMLKERGLITSGRKAELLERLENDDNKNSGKDEGDKSGDAEEEKEDPKPPYASVLPDPHAGKPESIIDDEGRKRYLCLDGKYRRGDPDSIACNPDNFSAWLTEWVVAARTGQLEGLPQKTFLPNDPTKKDSNPQGSEAKAGREMKSDDVLDKGVDKDGKPKWTIKPEWQKYQTEDA